MKYRNKSVERVMQTHVEDFCISGQSVFLLKKNGTKFSVQNLTVKAEAGLDEGARYTSIASGGNYILVGGIDSASKKSRIRILGRRTLEVVGQLDIDTKDDPDKNAVYKMHTFVRKEILVIVVLYKKWAFDIAYFNFKESEMFIVEHTKEPRSRGTRPLTVDRELIGSFQGDDTVTMIGPSAKDNSFGEVISF